MRRHQIESKTSPFVCSVNMSIKPFFFFSEANPNKTIIISIFNFTINCKLKSNSFFFLILDNRRVIDN